MKVSLCITNYNRTDLLFESFAQIINDDRISEIVISDDCSNFDLFEAVVEKCKGIEKVQIFRNETNLDCYRNKKKAVELATNEWVILFDSDNILTTPFIDSIFNQLWHTNPKYRSVAYAPDFARPHFDFRALDGKLIDKTNIASLLDTGNCSTMLNAMNYFVNRAEYLRVWDGSIDPVTSDSIYQNYRWINGGNSIFVVPGLEYEHRVSGHGKEAGSHYQVNNKRTPAGLHNDIIAKLREMK